MGVIFDAYVQNIALRSLFHHKLLDYVISEKLVNTTVMLEIQLQYVHISGSGEEN